jgi:threonine aldolase
MRRARLKAACPRRLSGHRSMSVADQLVALAGAPEAKLLPDVYGRGGAHEVIEETVQELLGKPAAVFLPKGVIAQLAALRTWADRSGRDAFALHPQSHIEADEDGAYAAIHRLRGVRVGREGRPFSPFDFDDVGEALAAVVVELPVRRAAFSLPTWEDLGAICDKARDLGAARHMDGARLWECIAWFDRSYAEICGLFDSVYVSFYKGLGGLGGAALAGDRAFIDEARAWMHRHGAHPYTDYPYVLAALVGLRRHLPRMREYHDRAAELAGALSKAGFRVTSPQTNAFQLELPVSPEGAAAASEQIAATSGVWLLERILPGSARGTAIVEIQIGDCAEYISVAEAVSFFDQLVEKARSA